MPLPITCSSTPLFWVSCRTQIKIVLSLSPFFKRGEEHCFPDKKKQSESCNDAVGILLERRMKEEASSDNTEEYKVFNFPPLPWSRTKLKRKKVGKKGEDSDSSSWLQVCKAGKV